MATEASRAQVRRAERAARTPDARPAYSSVFVRGGPARATPEQQKECLHQHAPHARRST